jgi:hypothetical protein
MNTNDDDSIRIPSRLRVRYGFIFDKIEIRLRHLVNLVILSNIFTTEDTEFTEKLFSSVSSVPSAANLFLSK